jgi:3-hydroxybutyryl-CoA dehydratase
MGLVENWDQVMSSQGRPTLFIDDISVGLSVERVRVVREEDVAAFAAVTGDDNPVHLDEAFAAGTIFKGRVAHGMLAAGYISALLGAELPGPGAIYLSQTLDFKRPIRIGDEVTVRATVKSIEGAAVTISTVCLVRRKPAVEGVAVVRAPRRPAETAA